MDARQAGLRSLECRSAGLRRSFDCRKASRFELEGSFTDIANHVHLSNPQPRIETTTTFSKITRPQARLLRLPHMAGFGAAGVLTYEASSGERRCRDRHDGWRG